MYYDGLIICENLLASWIIHDSNSNTDSWVKCKKQFVEDSTDQALP